MFIKESTKKITIKVGGVAIFILIALISLNIYLSNSKYQIWIRESKPFAENFIKLLMDNKIELLYQNYVNKKTTTYDEFKNKLNIFYKQIGNITSYKYTKGYPTYKNSSLDGLYLSYMISTDDKQYQSFFTILLDEHSHLPITGKFKDFAIFYNNHGDVNGAFKIDFQGESL